jgi:hypothetical protein
VSIRPRVIVVVIVIISNLQNRGLSINGGIRRWICLETINSEIMFACWEAAYNSTFCILQIRAHSQRSSTDHIVVFGATILRKHDTRLIESNRVSSRRRTSLLLFFYDGMLVCGMVDFAWEVNTTWDHIMLTIRDAVTRTYLRLYSRMQEIHTRLTHS